jgi:hypothetical protein
MIGYAVPALAIAYSLATSAYAVVNLPSLLQLAKEVGVAIPIITAALVESGVQLAAAVSLLVACATAIPTFLTSRTVAQVIGGALIFIPSFILSSLIFLAVFLPLRKIAQVAAGG